MDAEIVLEIFFTNPLSALGSSPPGFMVSTMGDYIPHFVDCGSRDLNDPLKKSRRVYPLAFS
jgi:hypothetical protein